MSNQHVGVPNQDVVLSVVCPTHDRADFLEGCVRSVLADAAVPMEMLVVDDCSTDGTRELVGNLAETFPRNQLRYLHQREKLGAPAARNRGLREALGKYVMFVDSDDVAYKRGILELVTAVERSRADFAYGRVAHTDGDRHRIPGSKDIGTPYSGRDPDIGRLDWHTMGAVYLKSFLLERVGFWNEALTGSQDWEYQARVKLAGARGVFVDCLVGDWRLHNHGRIGVSAYRPDYVQSVLIAALSIEKAAASCSQLNDKLRRRLCRRLVNHMIEASAHGNKAQAAAIRHEALRLSRGLFPERIVTLLLAGSRVRSFNRRLLTLARKPM